MMRSLFEPRNLMKTFNVIRSNDPNNTVHEGFWIMGVGERGGSETLAATVAANRGTVDADDRLSVDREDEYARGKISEHNFGRDPVGYGDIGRLVSEANPPNAGTFVPAPKDPYGASFKERLLSIARQPESPRVEDRRGVDIRRSFTVDEWINRRRMEPM